MGYERDTYYFDSHGEMTTKRTEDSVVEVKSVEHDVYGNPSYSATVLDIEGTKKALAILRTTRPFKERLAIEDALRR